MYSHNQLYGKWVIAGSGRAPETRRSLRVGLHTASHSALLYSASDIEVMDTQELGQHPFLRKLGPDVLDDALTWRDIAARLRDPAFRGRSLASLYLDQGFLAGIGNYMRSEILHDAGLHPSTRPKDLSLAETGALARATLTISLRAYEQAGVTNRPGRVRSLKRLGYKRRDYRFSVFAREGMPCYRCGTPVLRSEVSSRRIYFCPQCQVAAAGRS
jgi:endonuclease-8